MGVTNVSSAIKTQNSCLEYLRVLDLNIERYVKRIRETTTYNDEDKDDFFKKVNSGTIKDIVSFWIFFSNPKHSHFSKDIDSNLIESLELYNKEARKSIFLKILHDDDFLAEEKQKDLDEIDKILSNSSEYEGFESNESFDFNESFIKWLERRTPSKFSYEYTADELFSYCNYLLETSKGNDLSSKLFLPNMRAFICDFKNKNYGDERDYRLYRLNSLHLTNEEKVDLCTCLSPDLCKPNVDVRYHHSSINFILGMTGIRYDSECGDFKKSDSSTIKQ